MPRYRQAPPSYDTLVEQWEKRNARARAYNSKPEVQARRKAKAELRPRRTRRAA